MRIAALLLLLSIGACAQGNRRLDSIPYVPNRVDGSYQGRFKLIDYPGYRWWVVNPKVDSALCPHTTYGVVEIGDHTLYFSYAPNLTFNAVVGADGTIRQEIGTSRLIGQVKHRRLVFDIVTPVCRSHFAGDYILNHS